MPILTYETQSNGLLVQSDRGWLMPTPYSSRAIRVRYTERSDFGDQPSLMLVAHPDQHVRCDLHETESRLIFSTDDLTIEIDQQTLAFTYCDARGYLLTREPRRGGNRISSFRLCSRRWDSE